MKCPNCGAPLHMEDKFCTYCGAPNKLAVKHQQDMEHYEREFEKTQEEVLTKTRKAGSLAGFLIVILILIGLNIAAAFLLANSWSIKEDRRHKMVSKRAAEYKAVIDQMLEDQDYIAFSSFYYPNHLSGVKEFNEYDAVLSYSRNLADIYSYLLDLDNYEYRFADDRIDSSISQIAQDITSLYMDPRSMYFYDESLTSDKMEIIEDIRRQAEALLKAYAGFSEEETGDLGNLSKTRIEKNLKDHLAKKREDLMAAKEAKKGLSAGDLIVETGGEGA